MNILFSISGFEYGGSEIFLTRLCAELAKENNIHILNTENDRDNSALRSLLSKDIKVTVLPKLNVFKVGLLFNIIDKYLSVVYKCHRYFVKKYIKNNKIDIVVSFKYHSDAFITSVLNDSTIPIVISTRGCYSVLDKAIDHNSNEFTYFKNEVNRIVKRSNGLVWLTQENKTILSTLGVESFPENIQIYNGLNRSIENYIYPDIIKLKETENSLVVGMIARGDIIKGWDELITAFLLAQARIPRKVYLVLIGEGPHLTELKKRYKGNETIVFLGFISDTASCIRGFDLALLTSRFDTMPNSIIEYLACNKAVIASNVGEISSMLEVDQKYAGILLELKDGKLDPNDIADAIVSVLMNDVYRQELEVLSEKAFSKFSMERCSNEYLTFFNKVLHESSSY